jgi:membrane protease YdiL (CAAX protease family)
VPGARPVRRTARLRLVVPLLYLVAVANAELVTSLYNPQVGLALHGFLFLIIILNASLSRDVSERRFLMALSLAPLIRLLSLSMPLSQFVPADWYMIIGIPLFMAAYLVMRVAGYTRSQVGLVLGRKLPLQIAIGVAGLGLGYLEYFILHQRPLAESFTLSQVLPPTFILLVFTGLLEEFIFRGILQRAALAAYGSWIGLLYVSLLFAVLHIGYRSVPDFVFVLFVGLGFGLAVRYTHSILGVALAHGLTNIALFLIAPFFH